MTSQPRPITSTAHSTVNQMSGFRKGLDETKNDFETEAPPVFEKEFDELVQRNKAKCHAKGQAIYAMAEALATGAKIN
jgi:hypothetical protein